MTDYGAVINTIIHIYRDSSGMQNNIKKKVDSVTVGEIEKMTYGSIPTVEDIIHTVLGARPWGD